MLRRRLNRLFGRDERRVDSRTIYIGHRPCPATDAFIPPKFCDNRIVSSKVRYTAMFLHHRPAVCTTPLNRQVDTCLRFDVSAHA
uniref:Uncharacterized protein n=1 Tax=Hucho hucho TaxID=62062 RepID=A0A4W5NR01_9TELE